MVLLETVLRKRKGKYVDTHSSSSVNQTLPPVQSFRETITSVPKKSIRVGIQLPANYVAKGNGNAFWNKRYASKIVIQRKRSDNQRTQQMALMQQKLMQHQKQQQHQVAMLQNRMRFQEDEFTSEDDEEDGGRFRNSTKSNLRSKGKAIFAFLMLPSIIVILNSHKKMNKEESNVDLSALRSGGFGGMGGMGAGAAGIPGLGGVNRMGHPEFDRETPGVRPNRHPMQGEHESADEYTQRLMSHYQQRNSPLDPNSQRPGRENFPFRANPDPDADDDPFQDDPSVSDSSAQNLPVSDSGDPDLVERSENDFEANKLQPNDADEREEGLSKYDDYVPVTP